MLLLLLLCYSVFRFLPYVICFLCVRNNDTPIIYLTFICPSIANIIPNYYQQDATFLNLFISTDALHVSGGSSAHHQEHIIARTASGIVNCNDRVKRVASEYDLKIKTCMANL